MSGSAGNGTRTSGSVARNSDHRGGHVVSYFLKCRAMGKLQKRNDSECYTPSSEAFRIVMQVPTATNPPVKWTALLWRPFRGKSVCKAHARIVKQAAGFCVFCPQTGVGTHKHTAHPTIIFKTQFCKINSNCSSSHYSTRYKVQDHETSLHLHGASSVFTVL
jgi:hypothetical protein